MLGRTDSYQPVAIPGKREPIVYFYRDGHLMLGCVISQCQGPSRLKRQTRQVGFDDLLCLRPKKVIKLQGTGHQWSSGLELTQ